MSNIIKDFYIQFYIGHKGQFGHEYLQFSIKDGILKYSNNSNYKNDQEIKKQVSVSKLLIEEFVKIIDDAEITREDENLWPAPNKVGKIELIIRKGEEEWKGRTCKLGSLSEVNQSKDPEGLRIFYYLVQDLKTLVLSIMSLHFKIKPI
eukprot:NODE_751_length_4551_cov_0.292228.p3 type:complete len:149 gc:universal NODE_751_length_4551_cov_0.292228:2658-2212(-)